MGVTITGLDELENGLNQMQKSAEELDGSTVTLDDLFTQNFMRKYTNYSSIDELFEAGNFIVNSQEDFDNLSDSKLDLHISQNTKFNTFQDMLDEAGAEYALKQLGF